ncbi:MAG: molecular chaperone TorD family protein [Pseudomonadota bacterium]|nr:molecular chaperone TorD family protein [Pseudomonadota bacterium]
MQIEAAAVKERAVTEDERARADNYRLVAALLARPPRADLLAALRGIDDGDGPLAPIWRDLRQAADACEVSQVEDEYNRLFIGLGRGELMPYASWYLTGFLMERPLAELRAELARLGFARQEGIFEPEDHAASLCEVMALIITDDELNATDSKVFFDRFLGSWLGRFFEDLDGAESAAFYQAVARLGSRVMAIEREYFSMRA